MRVLLQIYLALLNYDFFPLQNFLFELEGLNIEYSEDCIYDRIVVYSGHRNDSDIVGVYCGKQNLVKLNVNNTIMTVEYISDATFPTYRGKKKLIKLTVTSLDEPYVDPSKLDITI